MRGTGWLPGWGGGMEEGVGVVRDLCGENERD